MGLKNVNVTRKIGNLTLQIGPEKNGWKVALVGKGVSIVTKKPVRAQIDGVIEVYKDRQTLNNTAKSLLDGKTEGDVVLKTSISVFLPDLFAK